MAKRPNFNIRHEKISIYVYLSIFLKKKKKRFIYEFVEYFIDEYDVWALIIGLLLEKKKKRKKNRISAILLIS